MRIRWRFRWWLLGVFIASGGISLLGDKNVSARIAGGVLLFLLAASTMIRLLTSTEMSRVWLQVWVDRPQEITGITCRRNRQLQERLWAELTRIGATEEQKPDEGVLVGCETALGTYLVWWSSGFRVGIPSRYGRLFAFSGTGDHKEDSWTDLPGVAFALLEEVGTGAGADGLWTVLADDSGYARRSHEDSAASHSGTWPS